MKTKERGVIYVATGDKSYYEQAKFSAISLRRFWPDAYVQIFTDSPQRNEVFSEHTPIVFSGNGFYDKVLAIATLPFRQTLFLDADTYVCGDLRPLFDVLDGVDLAMPIETYGARPNTGIPDEFIEMSTGVMVINTNDNISGLMKEWVYGMKINNKIDQPALRKALWKVREIRWAVLSQEYNFRPRIAQIVHKRVKIIHCNAHGVRVEKLEMILNKQRKERFLQYHGIPQQKDILTIGRNYCRFFYKRPSFFAQAGKNFLKLLFRCVNVKKWGE